MTNAIMKRQLLILAILVFLLCHSVASFADNFGEAIGAPWLSFSSSSYLPHDNLWLIDNNGGPSLRSHERGNLSSCLTIKSFSGPDYCGSSFATRLNGPGTFSFYWKLSADNPAYSKDRHLEFAIEKTAA